MAAEVWKVFIPCDLLTESDCFLLGHVSATDQSIYITASSQKVYDLQSSLLCLVGQWKSLSTYNLRPFKHSKPMWVNIWTDLNENLQCSIFIDQSKVPCTGITYRQNDLLQSSILTHKCELAQKETDSITSLVKVLSSIPVYRETGVERYFGPSQVRTGVLDYLVLLFLCAISVTYLPFRWLLVGSISDEKRGFLNKLVHIPTTCNQLEARARDLSQVTYSKNSSKFTRLKHINSCCRQLVDSFLGIMLMLVLMQDYRTQHIANVSLTWGESIAAELKTLLNWLMGAPAGLKLNSQLTHFLGNFFLYHIYLWTGYLYLLKPVLGYLVFYSSIAGVWGLTVQLALFQDILSTLTIHIYCFYVYAARLYRLQLYCLGSLWRLFRGKKWNVLRQRVDSAVYDADQLFVGTLLFTVLLFLLPTIGLYYVVFTLLRLLVLISQGIVGKVRSLLNRLPVWSLWLWLAQSNSLTDGAVFDVISHNQDSLILHMQPSRLGLSTIWKLLEEVGPAHVAPSWSRIVKNLCSGDLVYPWIEK